MQVVRVFGGLVERADLLGAELAAVGSPAVAAFEAVLIVAHALHVLGAAATQPPWP